MQISFRFSIGLCLLAVSACASLGQGPAQRILGEWRSSIGGYPVTVRYTANTVQVDNGKAVGYRLKGDRLRFPHGGSQVRIVSFPSRNEMVQTDPLTGGQQHYVRVKADKARDRTGANGT